MTADGAVEGHQGLLRVHAEGSGPAAPWGLFAQAAGDAAREAGFRLLQGRLFGEPRPAP